MTEESLETAAEHERILREIESTDTACIGPTLRYRGGAGSAGAGGARLTERRAAGVPRPGRGPAGEPVWREGEARLCWAAAPFGQQLSSQERALRGTAHHSFFESVLVLSVLGEEFSHLPSPESSVREDDLAQVQPRDLASSWTCSFFSLPCLLLRELPPALPVEPAERTWLITLHLLHRALGFVRIDVLSLGHSFCFVADGAWGSEVTCPRSHERENGLLVPSLDPASLIIAS